MTQENKYSYIKEVIEELASECEKEALTLTLTTSDNKGFAAQTVVGNKKDIGRNLIIQDKLIEKELEIPVTLLKVLGGSVKCGCANCRAKNGEVPEQNNPLKDLLEAFSAIGKTIKEGESE